MSVCVVRILFEEEKMKRHRIFFALIICLFLSSSALAVIHVDDFEYPKPGQDNFVNGVFQYNIVPMPGLGYTAWDITDLGPPHSGNALALWPAIAEVTFALNPGEYVDYAAIDFSDFANGTIFEVTGTLGISTVEIFWNGGVWESADTSGVNLGEITMIRLMSYEGLFDNLTINVVPEPATILLFGLGGSFLLRKRR